MAVPPKFAATRLAFATPPPPGAPHTIEVYLDYCCPFSAKIFRTLVATVAPMIRASPAWSGSVQLVFRQQIQPWHPSSTLMHEAALAVLRDAPDKFWDFSAALFETQKDYFDVSVVNETRNQTYGRLARLAGSVDGVDAGRVLDLLRIPERPGPDGSLNEGNAVTADVKLITKMARLVGVHVTPTVIFDGVVRPEVSSSWGEEQWRDFLQTNVG